MQAAVERMGSDVLCRAPGAEPGELRIDGEGACEALAGWSVRYDAAVRGGEDAELLAIGREFFGWLDENGWSTAWALGAGPRALEIRVDDPGEPLERALLDAPWELLARPMGYLADDAVQPFEVVRRIGRAGEPLEPRHNDLQLMFMAAAPQGQSELAFEDEEAAILAATEARQGLRQLQVNNPERGRHWHLARLYLGPHGGGALVARGKPKRKLPSATTAEQFLDTERGEVPVAKREEFVGRRRRLQAVLKAFREGSVGVLVHGMGNLGKSSLAARIATRLSGHATVVVFGKYDALTVFDRVLDAVPVQERKDLRERWREAVIGEPALLGEALEALLEDVLDTHPILLIVDDLETILEPPAQSDAPTPVHEHYRAILAGILTAFAKAQTASQLLITSRYRFTLPDGRGKDLAQGLERIPLSPMRERDRLKQLRAAARMAEREDLESLDQGLLHRALTVSGGNPGLEAIEHYQRMGAPPEAIRTLIEQGAAQDEANAALAFFKRMAFDTYRGALTEGQAQMLRAACVFTEGLPIPRAALESVRTAAGVATSAAALERLLGLGLADDWGEQERVAHAAANPLARPLVEGLDESTASALAAAALPALGAAWQGQDGAFAGDVRALEATRLALAAPAPDPILLNAAAGAAGRYLFEREHETQRAHGQVLQPALAKLEALGVTPAHSLLLVAADCAERLGETEAQDRALDALAGSEAEGADRASAQLYIGRRAQRRGELEAAQGAFEAAAAGFREAGQAREWAIALGGVADILVSRGELDEALRIRTEEQLPVFERLGDVRSRAVTQGQIAQIYQAQGELDEALSMHEQRLLTAKQLGDIDSIAHIKFSTAQIRLQRGDHQRGNIQAIYDDLAEAFAISQKLGRADFIAGIGVLFARVLAMGGHKDDALTVLDQAEAAYAKLDNAQGLEQVRTLRELIAKQ